MMPQPVYLGYLADPFVWRHAGIYYAIGTGPTEANGETQASLRVIPLLRSTDLQNWEYVHQALIRPDASLGGQFWAPEVAEHDGQFYLYYSVGQCEDGQAHQLRVAVSNHPEGPYEDTGTPLLLPGDEVFVFDPHPFRDDDGQWYLFYDRNYLAVDGTQRAGDAIAMRRLETMTTVSQDAISIVRPDRDWQRGPERQHSGRTIDWHTAEGPCVLKHQGQYYCFYSGSAWFTEGYGVDYAVSDTVFGPYLSDITTEEMPRVLKAIPECLRGPGHNSIVLGPDNKTQHIVYHAWDAEMEKRQMYIEPLEWTNAGPRVAR